MKGPNTRLEYLDALRGWAAFAVIVTHVGSQMGGDINLLTMDGARGVQLFFMLSAFTLFHTHNRLHASERAASFFIRRFFRIAPMFYAIVALLAVFPLVPRQHVTDGHALALLTFTHGFFPSYIGSFMDVEWSLSHEMVFYAFVPLLFLAIRSLPVALVGIVGALLVGGYATDGLVAHPSLFASNVGFPFFWFPNQFAAFFFGIALYFTARKPIDREWGLPLLIVAVWFGWALHVGGDIYTFPRHQLWNVAFFALVLALHARPFGLLVNRATVHFGKVSYSVYLLHLPVLFSVEHFTMHQGMDRPVTAVVNLVLTTAIVWPLATLTYRAVELPGIELGKRIIARLFGRASTPRPQSEGLEPLSRESRSSQHS
ncbi:acyltransferase family protein [Burkholderia latens]|uniref:acyltransferase family protein n=1 Tax=Burkholderia latens TaxID=488446 RepID=UPI001AE92ECD|nr:acyltransferase [Burkholderia latens]QTO42605.1 acyltransferase [Burkholderia latens]